MQKEITPAGVIIFTCKCSEDVPGGPEDTLMEEVYLGTAESDQKHQVFIENSAFDPGANIVMKDCPQCRLNFMTMIQIGAGATIMYVCSCGYTATMSEYSQAILAAK